MRKAFIECDRCGRQLKTEPPMYGGSTGLHWIHVTKHSSESGELLQAGESTFCSEKCLSEFMLFPKKKK